MKCGLQFVHVHFNQWKVINVVPDSPAAKAGVQVGDVFHQITETRSFGSDDYSLREAFGHLYNRPISLTGYRGNVSIEVVIHPTTEEKVNPMTKKKTDTPVPAPKPAKAKSKKVAKPKKASGKKK